MKKILLIVLLIILSAGLMGCTSATDEEYFEFDSGTGTIIGYDSAGGPDVVIPDEIDGFEVKEIGESSFYNIGLKSVELSDNIIKIKDNAFRENNLDSIEIPDSINEIGHNSFDENVEVIGKEYEVTFKTEGEIIEIQKVSHGGKGTAPSEPSKDNKPFLGWDSDFENVTSDLIVVANFSTNIKYFEFDSDTGTITGYDEEGGIDVFIPSEIDGVEVEKIGDWAFRNSNLEQIEIPDSVTEIGNWAFANNNIESIEIPNSVTEIGDYAFERNILEKVELPDTIDKIGSGAFQDNELESVEIGDSLEKINTSVFLENNLTSLNIPDNIEKIGNWAFAYNELTEVVLPSNIREISTTSFDYTDDVGIGVFDGFLGSVYKNNNKVSGNYIREDLDSDWELQ